MSSTEELPLSHLQSGHEGRLVRLGGERSFRRRLMELGLTPGVTIQVLKRAPLGDPIELEVRGCRLSIRRQEAQALIVVQTASRPVPSLWKLFTSSTLGEGRPA